MEINVNLVKNQILKATVFIIKRENTLSRLGLKLKLQNQKSIITEIYENEIVAPPLYQPKRWLD
ncbi:hypothetical protein SAMN05216302_10072 [Nitrosomonas aestuarii]|uniref:Uncharacterized protein n=1 Tax=Nitrosomonas aestuarii TaxID=52441 RepID=A0A1I3ZPM0_9PROT|nr:hypothetical protein SAMN05216302_10072 [Nitrosomonas aestuarii]|tara:strand:+ start:52 stop:243 length:192 start_codon:yes stop_codon:yes gene_type:complete